MRFTAKVKMTLCALLIGVAMSIGLGQQIATAASVTVNGAAANEVDQEAGTFHQLNALTNGTILDLNVSVEFAKSAPVNLINWGDLDMFIVHNGISVQLLDKSNPDDCCSGSDPFNVLFDDSAASSLGNSGAVGTFKPQSDFLSAFNGQNLTGIWELQIFEEFGFEGETNLAAWSITAEVTAIPLPAALPLYGAGLAVLGFIGWRRKRTG